MVSIQEAGLVRLYRQTPDGNKTQLAQVRVEDSAPAGGAPDAAGSSVSTPEKRITINSPVELVNDDILLVTFEPDAGGDGLDASDCIWSIPLVTPQGTKTLGRAQFANPTFADITLVATEQTIGGYKIIEGRARVSGKLYLDLQDDTA